MSRPDDWPLLQLGQLSVEDTVGRLLDHATELPASDLFLTTGADHVAVLVRHLGILRPLAQLPLDLGRRSMAHIKVMAGMDVTEKRRPLDGRWVWQRKTGTQVDLRINTIPTLHGEDFALRLLSRDFQMLTLDALGLLRHDYNRLLGLLNTPGGLILVTGPTGSGKTTTLYACLRYLSNGQRKINTIEDPIEYALDGIRQSQVNPKIDIGFAELLRSVLRQGPDIIMVGEIRDTETALTAVLGANSGHLVLATLHAPVAAGAIQSMLSLGVNAHFLSSCLRGVVAQRLLRTLCPQCKVSFDLSAAPATFDEVKPWLEPGQGTMLYGPRGCPSCHHTGYSGRTGVFEVLAVSKDIRPMIEQKQPTRTIRQQAVVEGMVEFRLSALLKVARGETAIEEVMRSVPAEYLGVEDENL
jgi:general secretion pathway protein E